MLAFPPFFFQEDLTFFLNFASLRRRLRVDRILRFVGQLAERAGRNFDRIAEHRLHRVDAAYDVKVALRHYGIRRKCVFGGVTG